MQIQVPSPEILLRHVEGSVFSQRKCFWPSQLSVCSFTMPDCNDCSLFFYLLRGVICRKCELLMGKSAIDKATIRVSPAVLSPACSCRVHVDVQQEKGQCKSCSIVFANLLDPLCNTCCKYFSKQATSFIDALLMMLAQASWKLFHPRFGDLRVPKLS